MSRFEFFEFTDTVRHYYARFDSYSLRTLVVDSTGRCIADLGRDSLSSLVDRGVLVKVGEHWSGTPESDFSGRNETFPGAA